MNSAIDQNRPTESLKCLIQRGLALIFCIAATTTLTAYIVNRSVSDSRIDGELINLAGRQRMLSQRIGKAGLGLGDARSRGDNQAVKHLESQLTIALQEFCEGHRAVKYLDGSKGLTGEHSTVVVQMFAQLDPVFEEICELGIGAREGSNFGDSGMRLVERVDEYLPAMNDIVFQLADESEARVNYSKNLTLVGWLASLALLVFLVPAVMRPAIRVLSRQQEHVEKTNQKLQASNRDLKEAVGFNSAVLETAGDAIVVIDEHGKIVIANRAAGEVFRESQDSFVGRNITDFMPAAFAAQHPQFLTVAVEDDRRDLLRTARLVEAQRPNGEVFPAELSVSRVEGIDRILFAGILRDVTERVEVEQRLARVEKLESVGQLAAGVAHEINTPLQFVSLNLDYISEKAEPALEAVSKLEQLLEEANRVDDQLVASLKDTLDKCGAIDPNDIAEAINESKDGCSRITEIITAMKAYSNFSDAYEPCDVNKLIRQTVVITRNTHSNRATLCLDLCENATLSCNRTLINQVLVNLIVNAVDAINESKNAEDSLGRIHIQTEMRDQDLVITFQDNGCGMPESVRSRIFDPFFTTKDVGDGSGQGLTIAYKAIVDGHQGTITVDSTEGEGTTFTITLPRNIERQQVESEELLSSTF